METSTRPGAWCAVVYAAEGGAREWKCRLGQVRYRHSRHGAECAAKGAHGRRRGRGQVRGALPRVRAGAVVDSVRCVIVTVVTVQSVPPCATQVGSR